MRRPLGFSTAIIIARNTEVYPRAPFVAVGHYYHNQHLNVRVGAAGQIGLLVFILSVRVYARRVMRTGRPAVAVFFFFFKRLINRAESRRDAFFSGRRVFDYPTWPD